MAEPDDEELLLRSVARQNAKTILAARQRAEQELVLAKEALERKADELTRSLSRLRATLESTSDGILVTDGLGGVTDWNEKYLEIWELPRELMASSEHRPLLTTNSRRFKHPQQFLDRVEEIYRSAPLESLDILELADGKVFRRFSKIQFIAAQNVGRVWSFRDITQHIRSEEALRDETRILELLNKIGLALAANLDLPTLLQTTTDAATLLSGATLGAFFSNNTANQDAGGRLHASSRVRGAAGEKCRLPHAIQLYARTFSGEGPIRCDDMINDPRYGALAPQRDLMPDQRPVRSYLAVPVISRSGEIIGGLFFGHPEPGIFRERTERIIVGVAAQAAVAIDNARLYAAAQKAAAERAQLLERERAARAQAEKVNEMKDEFLATLSHELMTPLSAIVGWSQFLKTLPIDPEDLQRGLAAIEQNASIQTQLVAGLLDMSRIASGKVSLDIQLLQPVLLIEAAIEAASAAASAKGIKIVKSLDLAVGTICGDANRLHQVLWNLLDNAIKFTPHAGRVQVQLERADLHVQITVTDNGIGIKPEFLPHVFDRFRQQDASTTRAFGGLGLGLSIVKHLVELHGGTVHAKSPGENLGTTFAVQLPQKNS